MRRCANPDSHRRCIMSSHRIDTPLPSTQPRNSILVQLQADGSQTPVDIQAATGKLAQMHVRLAALGRVIVAFSGGVDSTLVLKVAVEALGEQVMGVTAVSPSL